MFERFTERARQVVVSAQDESRSLRHNYIGTEHLLLGLLRQGEGTAWRVLESLDVRLDEVRNEIVQIIGLGQEAPVGQIPFTPRAKKVLDLSGREAWALGHDYIGTEHILMALAGEEGGVAARILTELGDVDEPCAEIVRRLGGVPRRAPERPTRRWRVRR